MDTNFEHTNWTMPPTPTRLKSGAEGHTIMQQEVKVEKESISVILSALPSSIQSRLPPLPSIRKSIKRPKGSDSTLPSPLVSGTVTPYSDAEPLPLEQPEMDGTAVADALALAKTRDVQARDPTAGPASGVDWRCGQQGISLVANAGHESKRGLAHSYDATFERSTYIDGVSYLLKGLPRDLDPTEVAALRKSIPPTLGYAKSLKAEPRQKATQQRAGGRSILHRGTQMLVAQAIVLFCFAWPYAVFMIQQIAQFERKHKVSEKFVGQGMDFANAAARHGVGLSIAVCSLGGGKVGQVLSGAVSWFVQGMAGGFSDGVEDGWSRVGGKR